MHHHVRWKNTYFVQKYFLYCLVFDKQAQATTPPTRGIYRSGDKKDTARTVKHAGGREIPMYIDGVTMQQQYRLLIPNELGQRSSTKKNQAITGACGR